LLLRRCGPAMVSALVAFATLPSVAPAQTTAVPPLAHVFVIVMENHGYSQIVGSSSAPYINALLGKGGLATNYFAVAHPSLPNYLALAGGSTFGITSDCTTCWINATNIGDSVEAAGKTWKAYEESMPSACFVGDSYPYAQKHNPFVYFNDIRTNPARCQAHDVPLTQLATDLASASTTPNYAFITPNMCDDMHDCSISTGDSWLQREVPQILGSPAFTTQRSLLALTWDEDDFTTANQVPLIMISSAIAQGTRSSLGYNHYSLVSTIDAILGPAAPNTIVAGAPPMSDLLAPPRVALCTGVTLSVNPGPTGATGVATTLTASSAGCPNPVYRFWVRDPGSRWSMVRDYGTSNTHVWAQTGAAGVHSLEVDVRDASERSVYDAVANLAYTVAGCQSASLTTTPASPQPATAQITLSASATCPGTPQYRFWIRPPGAAWRIVRDYGTTSSLTWTPPATKGPYGLEVDVRDAGATASYERVSNILYTIS
jgi:phosphatidylinositol-3-phosphatase